MLAPTGLLTTLPTRNIAVLTGRTSFPHLIAAPFPQGLIMSGADEPQAVCREPAGRC
jgi:hypothetical protein